MDKETFIKKVSEAAEAYALETIVDAQNHMDAVNVIKDDYIEGAKRAYCLLNNVDWD